MAVHSSPSPFVTEPVLSGVLPSRGATKVEPPVVTRSFQSSHRSETSADISRAGFGIPELINSAPVTPNVSPRVIDHGIRLETARNLRAQHLEILQSAIQDWHGAAGTGNYRLICARFVLRCIRDFRWFDKLAYARYRETLGDRRVT